MAWTPSTKGTVSGSAIQVEPPAGLPGPAARRRGVHSARAGPAGARGSTRSGWRQTKAEMDRWVAETQPKLSARWCWGERRPWSQSLRRTGEAPAGRSGQRAVRSGPSECGPRPGAVSSAADAAGRLSASSGEEQIDAMLLAGGAVVRLNDAGARGGHHRCAAEAVSTSGEDGPDGDGAQKEYSRIGPAAGQRRRREADFQIIQSRVSGRKDQLQRDRRDPGARTRRTKL